ncbi:SWIM zinc finger family protein [Paenibacillus sambharensis]|uniref:SWIM zinc finger family protein n=1 Tax=Paenibacillus sambharensis TaxID=1803190 RepID=A0A2W1M0K0_9BACL|nr:SWIM zinc finger family protein [Paenibacillus sambharensis]PZD97461.1 SWIM zinc finger family protein [Paenibacillus sambharensis]
MAQITEAYIDALAPNAAAIKNGRSLAKKNSFQRLCQTEDGTLIFGECKGSGKEPYSCSADFIKPDSPVFRCSCPSRQFPCKHNLGLLYAYASGSPFQTGEIPQDIADKREKAEKREERKQEAAASGEPVGASKRKTSRSALVKKMNAQLEGIDLLDKLVKQVVNGGLAALDAKSVRMLEDQAKQLGGYYIPGMQAAFRELLLLVRGCDDQEQQYTAMMDQLTILHTLIKRSRDYLTARKENEELPADTGTRLEEWIGHAWQLAELRELGLMRSSTELLQLSFRSYADEARAEYIDEGFWLPLGSDGAGDILVTRHYRPFRAAKHIREDDSCFLVVQTKELAVYPGDMNPRVRWEDMTMREPESKDYEGVKAAAKRSYPEVIKQVKNQLKSPLAYKNPVVLLHYAKLGKAGETYVLEDEQGKRLALGEIDAIRQPTLQLLPMLGAELHADQAVLVMFEHQMGSRRLTAQPLAFVTEQAVIRLLY